MSDLVCFHVGCFESARWSYLSPINTEIVACQAHFVLAKKAAAEKGFELRFMQRIQRSAVVMSGGGIAGKCKIGLKVKDADGEVKTE